MRGLTVTLQDRAQQYVEPALIRARELFKKRLRAPGEAAAAEARLIVDLEAAQVGSSIWLSKPSLRTPTPSAHCLAS